MIVGCVKEIKIGENRVGLTPYGTDTLVKAGRQNYPHCGRSLQAVGLGAHVSIFGRNLDYTPLAQAA